MSPGEVCRYSLFIRLRKYPSPGCRCQGGWDGIMSQTCNLRIYNALHRSQVSKTARLGAPSAGWLERAFVIIGLRRNPPEWRYRLGVRTEDSQSSNTGSIPVSATNSPLSSDAQCLRHVSADRAVFFSLSCSRISLSYPAVMDTTRGEEVRFSFPARADENAILLLSFWLVEVRVSQTSFVW